MRRFARGALPLAAATTLAIAFVAPGIYQKQSDLSCSDSALFAYGGFVLEQGGHLYRDVWDHKPPGVYAISAMLFHLAGPSRSAVTFLDTTSTLLAILGCIASTWRSTRRRLSATIAAVAAAFYLNLAAFHRGGGLAESYMIAFMAWSSYSLVAGKTSTSHARTLILLAGALAGLACLCKPTAGTIVLATFGVLLVEGIRSRRFLSPAAHMAMYAAGLSLPLLTACAWFAWQRTLAEMIDAAVLYNLSYMRHGLGLRKLVEFHRYHNLLLLPAGIILLAAAWTRLPAHTPTGKPSRFRNDTAILFLSIWAILEWLGSYTGNFDNGQYMLALILPLACLTGIDGDHLIRTAKSRQTPPNSRRAVTGCLLLSLALLYLPARDQWRYTGRVYHHDMPDLCVDRIRTGLRVRELTTPPDTIWVWGYAPEVYFAARRLPATCYVFDGPFLNSNRILTNRFDRMLEQLATNRPAFIVDASTTGWFATGLTDTLPAHLPPQKAAYAPQLKHLRRWVQANYQYEQEFGELVIYRLKLEGP